MDCYLGDIYRLYIHDVSSRKARGAVEVGEAEVHKRKRPLQVHGPGKRDSYRTPKAARPILRIRWFCESLPLALRDTRTTARVVSSLMSRKESKDNCYL